MTTIVPEKEELKKAIKWISAHREENPKVLFHTILEQAIFKFDLSPADTEFLMNFFHKTDDTVEE
jgi:hypothetical protein